MGTAESAQLPHPPTPLENTRPILPFFRSLEVLCYFFLHFNEAMHVFRVFSPPRLLVCFSYRYRQNITDNNGSFRLGSHPFWTAFIFLPTLPSPDICIQPCPVLLSPPLVWHWIPTFPTCASHSFFPHLLPFTIATQGAGDGDSDLFGATGVSH